MFEIIQEREISNDVIPGVTDNQIYREMDDKRSAANDLVAAEMKRLNNHYDLKDKERKDNLKGFYSFLDESDPALWVLEDLVKAQNKEAKQLGSYLLQPETFANLIYQGYGTKYNNPWSYFSYDAIDALAEINDIHVIIKRLSADHSSYETVHEYPVENGRVVIMLHTMEGIPDGIHPRGNQTLNHFNRLSLARGELVSPIFTFKHAHNVSKSKSTSIGKNTSFNITTTRDSGGNINGVDAKMVGGIPGSASFGHDRQSTQSKTKTTITRNINVVSHSDTSGNTSRRSSPCEGKLSF